ncbi:MAG: hypothetical protein GF408_02710 [Candidatus Omnitrophica bacterium]|nr:hypothetical protein [Candidatus Omnitrophota bacterium]
MGDDYFKMDFQERRRFRRHLLDNPLRFRFSEKDSFRDTHTIDASEGGLMFTSNEEARKGSTVNIQMPLDDKTYEVKARVARVEFDESIGQYRVGVEFTDYTESFRITLKLKLLNVLIATTVFSSAFFGGTPRGLAGQTAPAAVTRPAMPRHGSDQGLAGKCYGEKDFRRLAEAGAGYATICVTRYMDNHNATEIKVTGSTLSDADLRDTIKKAREAGLKVLLKPRIGIINNHNNTYSSSDVGFSSESDWVKWFKEYRNFIGHYARLADSCGVEIFCIGTELSFTTQREDKWREVIAETRGVYEGKLVYASSSDNFTRIAFWKELDLIGIEAAAPSEEQVPTTEEMKEVWNKWHDIIASIQMSLNKPVILTNWMI